MTIKGRAIGGSSYRFAIEPEPFNPGVVDWPVVSDLKPWQPGGDNSSSTPAQMLDRISQQNIAYLVARYPRGVAKDFSTNVLVNPETFSESVEPQYSRRPVLGLSHEVIQYIRTASREISMQLWVSWDVYIQRKMITSGAHPVAFRDFMVSLCVPAGARLSPPLVELHWPGANLGFMGVVSSLNIEYTRFSSRGDPIEYTVDVTFLEVAAALMTSPYVGLFGLGKKAQMG